MGTLGVEQFPNRTSNIFFLTSIFLSSMSASIKKVSQNRTKYILQQTNKQTNKQNKRTTIFLPKINKLFLSPILQNLKGRSVLVRKSNYPSLTLGIKFLNFLIRPSSSLDQKGMLIRPMNMWNQSHLIKHFFNSFWKSLYKSQKRTFCLEISPI